MKLLISFFALLVFTFSSSAQQPTPTPSSSPKPDKLPFLMAVEDAFYIAGRGAVVAGRVERGSLKKGDKVEILGSREPRTVTVSSIEKLGKEIDTAVSGEHVGFILRGVERDGVKRGDVIVFPGSVKQGKRFEAVIDMIATSAGGRRTPLTDNARVLVSIRTANLSAIITLLPETTSAAPGASGIKVIITLPESTVIEEEPIFAIREAGRTIATGKITKLVE